MIVVELVGGLGNQLFQYAAGRALAARLGVPLALDRRWFAGGASRGYALDCFAITAGDADPALLPMREGKILGRLLSRLGGKLAIHREAGLAFDPAVTRLPDNSYLRGNFPSERYFADQEVLIRREFTFAGEPDAPNAALLDEIAKTNAVSLHIRRGDYVANPKIAKVHGTVDLGFYTRAMAWIAERVSDPTVFVFSDDPAWARTNLALTHPTRIVDLNGPEQPAADMRLMAACRHHILANSTFSWWGAWLNPSPQKIVVAPEPWFRDPALDSRDIVPKRWVKLPA